jgi:hypothetical protein
MKRKKRKVGTERSRSGFGNGVMEEAKATEGK